MSRVVLAPDKFKGTLTAAEVAAHLSAGIRSVLPDAEIVVVPVSDGGDGLLDAAVDVGYERVPVRASGPTGVLGDTWYARRGDSAAIEMAEICGLAKLPDGVPAPATATTRGVGEVVAAALDAGCREILLGVGGSASTDGGSGLVSALGARVLGAGGDRLHDGGVALADASTLDLTRLHPGVKVAEIDVACDVDNPLTGPHGAAAVYGPQKGAGPELVEQLDRAMSHWADVVAATTGTDHRDLPGAGAAGGLAFGAVAVLGARLRTGAEVVQELTGLEEALAGADLVVTGEGSLDEQTLRGKAPAGVAAAAQRAGVAVVAVAGQCLLDQQALDGAGISAVHTLLDEASSPEEAFEAPGPLLERIGARVAHDELVSR